MTRIMLIRVKLILIKVLKYLLVFYISGEVVNFIDYARKSGSNPIQINNISLESLKYSFMATVLHSFKTGQIKWDWAFNDTYIHSLPILQNILSNVFSMSLNNGNNKHKPIVVENYPFKQTNNETNLAFDGKIYTFIMLMSVILGCIPPMIAVEVVEDRQVWMV